MVRRDDDVCGQQQAKKRIVCRRQHPHLRISSCIVPRKCTSDRQIKSLVDFAWRRSCEKAVYVRTHVVDFHSQYHLKRVDKGM